MSFNLVDLVKDQVKGQLIGHMGNLLGNEGGKATNAVDSMIPALLNGITGTAGTQKGADSLFGAIQDQDDSLLDNMGNLLGGGQASTVIDNGNSVLSNLFGGGGLGKLAGALSAFSGVSRGGTSSLMGILAPIILGVLKRKVMGDGLNAGGLASMLTGQAANVNAAMPQGLTDQLSSSGFLSSIGDAGAGLAAGAAGMAGSAASGAANAVDSARDAAGNAVDAVGDAAGNVSDAVSNAAGDVRDGVANAAGNVRDGATNLASDARDGAANVAGAARDGVGNAADAVGDTAAKGGSMFRWLLPLIILAALAWAAFTFLLPGAKDAADSAGDAVSDGAATATDAAASAADTATDAAKDTAAAAGDAVKETAEAAGDAVKETAEAAGDAASGAAASVADALTPDAFGEQLGGLFGSATETLNGITDAESATAAIPAFGELGSKIDSMTEVFGNVPEDARSSISTVASEGLGKLQPLIDKVLALPGVGAVLNPVLGPILEKLQEFAG